MNLIAKDILMHYGMPRRSGRYPWGSGDNPYQHSGDFLSRIEELKKQGFKETEIAKEMGLTTTQLRAQKSLAKAERRALQVATAKGLREKGHSLNEIAEKMGFTNDSSVRSLLNEQSESRMNQAKVTADFLKKIIDEKGMVDVGTGVERELGISKEKLKQALDILEMEGYPVYGGGVPQVTNPGKQTNIKVVCPKGTEHKDIYQYENIHSVRDYEKILTEDGQKVRPAFQYPESMDSKRLKINYAEDGGIEKDGVIEIRRGVDDLSLGNSHYAQVRILVDNTHYMKGMAVYSDNLPDGVDVLFNTNKKKGAPLEKVLKPIKDDPDNPFGSLIKERGGQSYYVDKDGKEHLSLINKRSEEGDWGEWSKHLPSQFLSKQSMTLIKKQLGLAAADKTAEYDEICSLTNPTVKKALLKSFADDCDSAAVHLQAAALPRQKYQVILPLTTLKNNEIYAPNYKNGEQVALVRFPHGGTFEIPILTVNNKQAEGKRVIGNASKDAVGINSKVAERLSGADFDGDTVMVIPTGPKVKITSTPPLKGLEGFDPKASYGPESTDRPYQKMNNTQTEMGKISNLITDMTLKGATQDELARAVRHSMVVIDAEKHNLDYKRSAEDNAIDSLKKKYQGRMADGRYKQGAATLISRAKSEVSVTKRKGSPIINEDGSLSYKTVDDPVYVDKNGKTKQRTQPSTQMAETKNAYTLSSGTPQEEAYADYANKMKSLANQARKEMIHTGKIPYSSSAKLTYQKEVDSLNAKLNTALKNAPRERQAQVIANAVIAAKKQDNPDMGKAEIKKASQQALTAARNRVGAERKPIVVTDREWEAIQSGAISERQLEQIINHVDIDNLRQRATPRATTSLSAAKISRIASMGASGYSTAEIAEALGISTSTVSKYL
ncbi:MAG: helix-turn-helix domain-containing protein [Eubacterium sp.]|nr:helix-turn-helix domain-containing protein [Eubacterium sp.]